MESIISNMLTESLNEQLAHEKMNANIYLFIAGDLMNRGFDKLGKFFKSQHDEETSHALIIFNLLTDLNAPVKLLEIDDVELEINTINDIAKAFYEREILTTNSLIELKRQSISENCGIVEEKMRVMIANQQVEMEEVYSFGDRANLCGADWFKVMLWDGSLKE